MTKISVIMKTPRSITEPIPFLTNRYRGTVLLATVKGDVHDIGKNIVGVVLGCNNYRIIDLGVMVPCDRILAEAVSEKVDIIGLSGLITPSLDEMVHVAKEMKKRGLDFPLLIGGATTSKRHTAVKIAPVYDRTVYVKDASLSVGVVQGLCDDDERDDFLDDMNEVYSETRDEYYKGLVDKKYHTLAKARQMARKLDFPLDDGAEQAKWFSQPKFLGNKVYLGESVKGLRQFIDWTELFSVYQLVGTYPTRDYPKILKDGTVGEECQKLYDEANELLDLIEKNSLIKCAGVVGIHPANSVGDDIEVYKYKSNGNGADNACSSSGSASATHVFYGLRQQLDTPGEAVCVCQSDFVLPKTSGKTDYIGGIVCTGGIDCAEAKKTYEEKGEIDKAILLDAVADRLAEAFTEKLHVILRKELWGYCPDEELTTEQLLKVKYRGIRPAQGYPTQPDHREKTTLFDLLEVEELTKSAMTLTDSFMMLPAASVSALVFAHPEAKYFAVGQVDKDQVADYAQRRGETVEENERWLGSTVCGYL